MSDLAKTYDPSAVEDRWYAEWLQRKAFAASVDPEREPHTIMIPPPNVTGILHMGHILNNTLQDIFTRRARLEGKMALWFPGTDHAGIATQSRVERKLKEEGQDRRDLGREKFVERVWEWKEEHGGIIFKQLQKLGASCDWDRQSFTLDEGYAEGVLEAFVRLYRRGYIYRGLRMSNWCPKDQTALSNEEVEMRPQQGQLYKMRYELVEPATGPDGVTRTHLEISTTRPETIMGDTAVAVHPDDERYQHLVGKSVWRPFPRAPIPIIADTAVELDFGTGCLKVTPAHDTVDFEIGKRHDLPILDVLNPDGTLNDLAGPDFVGMDRFEARKKAAKLLDDLDLLVATEPYENAVGFSERGGVPIEPRLTEQWWLRYPKVDEAKRAVEKGIIQFHPKRWEKTYMHWLGTMQREGIDWCISRQLWWGHRIPVWYRKGADRAKWSDADYANPELVHVSLEGPPDPENWEQDTDVLDTWASSWLWPFANFGWPDNDAQAKRELDYFYPTSTLVTGFDIIFLWVARMVMAGLEFTGDGEPKARLSDAEIAERVPFRDVYITGLIRDAQGRKMSKSLGNSPDPLDLIAKYGADGLRLAIVSIAPTGQDILFSEERIAQGRNFCNKLWNVSRFRQMQGEIPDDLSREGILGRMNPKFFDEADAAILRSFLDMLAETERGFARYELAPTTSSIYGFFWSDFCDWYIEVSKTRRDQPERLAHTLAIQDFILREFLLLMHSFIPFITEELWHLLGFGAKGSFIQDTKLGKSEDLAKALATHDIQPTQAAADEIAALRETLSQLRALKAEYNLATRNDLVVWVVCEDASWTVLEKHLEKTRSLTGIERLERRSDSPEGSPAVFTPLGTLYLDVASAIDVQAEIARLEKELADLEKRAKAGESKPPYEKFTSKAPPEVVEGAKKQLEETRQKRDAVARVLKGLAKGAAASCR